MVGVAPIRHILLLTGNLGSWHGSRRWVQSFDQLPPQNQMILSSRIMMLMAMGWLEILSPESAGSDVHISMQLSSSLTMVLLGTLASQHIHLSSHGPDDNGC